MTTSHPSTFSEINFSEVVIPYNNVQPNLKEYACFVIKKLVLCTSLFMYRDKVRIYDLMEEFTESFCTLYLWKIQYRIESNAKKSVVGGIYFCGRCT